MFPQVSTSDWVVALEAAHGPLLLSCAWQGAFTPRRYGIQFIHTDLGSSHQHRLI